MSTMGEEVIQRELDGTGRKKGRRRGWLQKTTCVPRPRRQDMRVAHEASVRNTSPVTQGLRGRRDGG